MNPFTFIVDFRNDLQVKTELERIGRLVEACKANPDMRSIYEVTRKPFRKQRSVMQNRYYFGVIVATLAQAHGYDAEYMHEDLQRRFNGRIVVDKLTGEIKQVPGSTKGMSTIMFEEYCDRIRCEYLLEYGIMIPLPHETILQDQ
jgi:hypothetical protein